MAHRPRGGKYNVYKVLEDGSKHLRISTDSATRAAKKLAKLRKNFPNNDYVLEE